MSQFGPIPDPNQFPSSQPLPDIPIIDDFVGPNIPDISTDPGDYQLRDDAYNVLLSESGRQESLYVYPESLLNEQASGHFIMLQAFDVKGVTATSVKNGSQDVANTIGGDQPDLQDPANIIGPVQPPVDTGDTGGVLNNLLSAAQKAGIASGSSAFSDRIFGLSNSLSSRFSTEQQTDLLGRRRELRDTIVLYMPNENQVSYSMSYEQGDTVVASGVRAAREAFRSSANGNDQAVSAGAKDVARVASQSIANFGKNAINFIGPDNSNPAALARVVVNPYLEFLFKSVNARTFTYSFSFSPRNEREVEIVDTIIKTLKFHAHPHVEQNLAGFLSMPSEFDILFYSNNKENRYLHRTLPCVLTNISMNYAPNGSAAFFKNRTSKGQAPTEISVSLTFQEVGLLDRRHVLAGF